jgi:hypothetical protein
MDHLSGNRKLNINNGRRKDEHRNVRGTNQFDLEHVF